MAQDVRDTQTQPPAPGLFSEQRLVEKPFVTEWTSALPNHPSNGQNSITPSMEPFRNGMRELSATFSQTYNGGPEASLAGPSSSLGKNSRSLPAWIRSVEEPEDDAEAAVTSRLLPPQPDDAIVAQHNHAPYDTSRSSRGYFAPRETLEEEPSATTIKTRESRWKNFSRTVAYPREAGVEEKLVTTEWLNENHGDYSQPWRGQLAPDEDTEDPLKMKRRREMWFKRFHATLLKSPIVPLIFRLTVWCFSLTALALGGSIQKLSGDYNHPQGPSALMAIIVDAVALVYLVYITWDEYTSKPLGLRSPSAKARLILLDIFFIVFDSANLSLAFESLSTATGACTVAEVNQEVSLKNDPICDRQIALACVLLIALIAWLTTFSISVLRLVERVTK